MLLTLLPVLLAAGISSTLYYLFSAILIATVLVGIYLMAKVETAVLGNRLGAIAMLLAIILTLSYYRIFSVFELWVGMLIGAGLGLFLAVKVKMIQMPQMVGLLNGFGGLASMIAGILTLIGPAPAQYKTFSYITAGLAVVVGGLTWTGSAIAAAKLHKLIKQKPVVHKNHQFWTLFFLLISAVASLAFGLPLFQDAGFARTLLVLIAIAAGNLFGYFLAIRVGGADMPITISLLNSFSGVAGSIAGMAIGDMLLVTVGGIVGASGLLLTQIMCRSMNRHLMDILLGKTSAPPQAQARAAAPAKEEPAAQKPAQTEEEPAVQQPAQESSASWLRSAQKIMIVPGYGMALSQAQPLVKQLADRLEADGKSVEFAIHPVAGRMPGHMNVLLAEVDIPYEKLHEMQEINDGFAGTDLVLVIGANDVINPAANTAEGTPIYGMPVLNVGDASRILIFNFDDKPGYAGVENPLYQEAKQSGQHVRLHLGDAKATLQSLMDDYRESGNAVKQTSDVQEENGLPVGTWVREAKTVMIVPGYGMALSQAQPLVKQLADRLEADGKAVEFAIHPVAGRMPGHMNVLLAEVDVPYEKLHEMQEINESFASTDLVFVIGANDVINPAANTAEGTPIYGMPVLNVGDAKHIVIMNFDDKPGYAGVENPLYTEANASSEHVLLILGDAKASLRELMEQSF